MQLHDASAVKDKGGILTTVVEEILVRIKQGQAFYKTTNPP
jgi:hypothetical protein